MQKLLNQLTQLPLSLRREYESSIEKHISSMSTETQINNLFILHLNRLTSFIDYGLIEYVIKKFGSDVVKRDMRSTLFIPLTPSRLPGHTPGSVCYTHSLLPCYSI